MTAPSLAALVGKHQGQGIRTGGMVRIVVRVPRALLGRVDALRSRFDDNPSRAAIIRAGVELVCVMAEGPTTPST